MIVAVSRIPLPKTERYLCWVRVASKGYEKDVPGRKPDFIGLFCCPKAVFRSFKIVDEKTAFSL